MKLPFLLLAVLPLLLAACETMPTTSQVSPGEAGRRMADNNAAPDPARAAMYRQIPAEPPGDYFVGRRYYKKYMCMWGYVRAPRTPWHTARMIMLDENLCLAPDRAASKLGSDDNTEYRILGDFTGRTIYEPASNDFYPEFRARSFSVISSDPPSIFANGHVNNPEENILRIPQKVTSPAL